MSTPVSSFINGGASVAGGYVAAQYVLPEMKPAMDQTAKKVKEVINENPVVKYSVVPVVSGAAIAGPIGASVGLGIGVIFGTGCSYGEANLENEAKKRATSVKEESPPCTIQ